MNDDAPPVEPGKIRVYEDHTGRWYRDVTPDEYELLYNSEELQMLREEVQKEIDKEMNEQMLKIYNNYSEFSSSIQEEIDSKLMDDVICEGMNRQEMSPERKKYLLDKWRAVFDNPAPYKTSMILEGQETFTPKIDYEILLSEKILEKLKSLRLPQNDEKTRIEIKNSLKLLIESFCLKYSLQKKFSVTCDAENNSPEAIANNTINVQVAFSENINDRWKLIDYIIQGNDQYIL